MTKLEAILKEMTVFGFTKEQLSDILDSMTIDILEKIMADAAEILSDAQIADYEKKFLSAKTQNEKTPLLEEIARLTYKDKADEKREEIVVGLLSQALDQAKKMRDLYQRYQKGDPDAVNQVQEVMKDPNFVASFEEAKKVQAGQ